MPARNGGVRPPSSDIALPDVEIPMVYLVNTCFGLAHVVPAEQPDSIRRAEPGGECGLSVRAINVLKILADEIMGETPPRDDVDSPGRSASKNYRGAVVDRAKLRSSNGRRDHPLGRSARGDDPAGVPRRQIAFRDLAEFWAPGLPQAS